jgi:hypothetical protein
MSMIQHDKVSEDGTRLGEFAALQPISGVKRVDETFAVNGHGRGGYVRMEETRKAESQA